MNIAWLRRGGAPLASAVWGAVLAQGAPGGLWVLDAVRCARSGESLAARLAAEAPVYAYVSVSTTLAFATFGWLLGRKAERLRELARTDPLTGLLNRRACEERLEEEAARSEPYGLPLSVLLVDVDGLKRLNDEHGHRCGDAALRQYDTRIVSVNAELRSEFARHWSAAVGAWYEDYEVRDSNSQGLLNYVPGSLFLAANEGDYRAWVGYLRLTRRF